MIAAVARIGVEIACGHELEALRKFSDAPLLECPSCHAEALIKKVSAAGFQLKGSGWYATDFKGSGSKPAAKPAEDGAKPAAGNGESKSETKSDAKSDTKTETKSETAAPAKAPTPASGTQSS